MKSLDEINTSLQLTLTNESPPPDSISSSTDETDEEFCLIDHNDCSEVIDFKIFPWLETHHPLYFPTTQSNHMRWAALDKFSVEHWYPHLKKHTFESRFIPLNDDDIQYLMGNNPRNYDSTRLEKIFNNILSEFNHNQAFMRLSTRSPKDSKYLFNEAANFMSRDYFYWPEPQNKHQQRVSFVASMLKAMKIKNGKQIIDSIVQSPRIYSDFMALIDSAKSSDTMTHVILREWYDIRPDHEFRVFVSRRDRQESIVTAISQYFHFLYFDKKPTDCFNFFDEKDKKKLIKAFETYVLKAVDPDVATFLNFSHEYEVDNDIREYIIDLALIPIQQYHGSKTQENIIKLGKNTYAIIVIELNPFAPAATGCGLFNWKNDLMTLWGKASCEYPIFKYRTTPRDDLSAVSLLPSDYEAVIQRALCMRLQHPTHNPLKQLATFASHPSVGLISALVLVMGICLLIFNGGLALGLALTISGAICLMGHSLTKDRFFKDSPKSPIDESHLKTTAVEMTAVNSPN